MGSQRNAFWSFEWVTFIHYDNLSMIYRTFIQVGLLLVALWVPKFVGGQPLTASDDVSGL